MRAWAREGACRAGQAGAGPEDSMQQAIKGLPDFGHAPSPHGPMGFMNLFRP